MVGGSLGGVGGDAIGDEDGQRPWLARATLAVEGVAVVQELGDCSWPGFDLLEFDDNQAAAQEAALAVDQVGDPASGQSELLVLHRQIEQAEVGQKARLLDEPMLELSLQLDAVTAVRSLHGQRIEVGTSQRTEPLPHRPRYREGPTVHPDRNRMPGCEHRIAGQRRVWQRSGELGQHLVLTYVRTVEFRRRVVEKLRVRTGDQEVRDVLTDLGAIEQDKIATLRLGVTGPPTIGDEPVAGSSAGASPPSTVR